MKERPVSEGQTEPTGTSAMIGDDGVEVAENQSPWPLVAVEDVRGNKS